ncbi:MAG: hypothetical protein K6C05_07780 [Anaerovibrio sp.]|uniref:hypothetical protein n=1 Tax=Anaerovibrio sp. TaxID=1872532 RepID=UPI0025E272B3|nr:hypothetical protein [Anaerovibrio sp.]MCR5176739.1 hypothetical protein [Anaerovibrio sp.]
MTTEILGFIIIVGAIIVLLAKRQLQKADDDPEVIEASAGRLRYELEQSADEIISRMAGHIDHLEKLLKEADSKSRQLERRINELQRMQTNDIEKPSEVGNNEFAQVLEDNINKSDFSSMAVEYDDVANDMPGEASPADFMGNEEAGQDPEGEMSDAQIKALEYIREASMTLEAAQNDLGLNVVEEADDIGPAGASGEAVATQAQDNKPPEEDATGIAKKLLQAGYDPEEVGRITGLGMNAIRLIVQMQGR